MEFGELRFLKKVELRKLCSSMVFAGCLNFLWALLVFVAFWEHIGIDYRVSAPLR